MKKLTVISLCLFLSISCKDSGNDSGGDKPQVVQNEDCDSEDKVMMYIDIDGDGYGSSLSDGKMLCDPSPGYVTNDYDCADNDGRAFPGQTNEELAAPIYGDSITSEYDYNCDGMYSFGNRA